MFVAMGAVNDILVFVSPLVGFLMKCNECFVFMLFKIAKCGWYWVEYYYYYYYYYYY